MGNANSCIRHFYEVFTSLMGGSSTVETRVESTESVSTSGTSIEDPIKCSNKESTEGGRRSSSRIEELTREPIERSECHWSQTINNLEDGGKEPDDDCNCNDEELETEAADNREEFKTLRNNPKWGSFFRIFQNVSGRSTLMVGEMFAEGGQAKLFHARVHWSDPRLNERDARRRTKWVLKVFKKGIPLRVLKSQWPEGMLKFHTEKVECAKLGKPQLVRYNCEVYQGILMRDGSFAFLMQKEGGDLRSLIVQNMESRIVQNCGPFHKEFAESIMYRIALGMNWLHSHDIVHRDLKSANVLCTKNERGQWYFYVADFECSIGVVGTEFWRAPEILQAVKTRQVFQKPEIFSKAVDIYAYGMTCYEILTGKVPFEDHSIGDYDIVLNGQRPIVPEYIEEWQRELLSRCWQSNPEDRPSIGEILELLLAKSSTARISEEKRKRREQNLALT